jgi:hypothetical protein
MAFYCVICIEEDDGDADDMTNIPLHLSLFYAVTTLLNVVPVGGVDMRTDVELLQLP